VSGPCGDCTLFIFYILFNIYTFIYQYIIIIYSILYYNIYYMHDLGQQGTQKGRAAVWQLEGCWFNPRLRLAKCRGAPEQDTLTTVGVSMCVYEWVNVRQYCKVLWIKSYMNAVHLFIYHYM